MLDRKEAREMDGEDYEERTRVYNKVRTKSDESRRRAIEDQHGRSRRNGERGRQ